MYAEINEDTEVLALKSIQTSYKAENDVDWTSQLSKKKKKGGKVEVKRVSLWIYVSLVDI